jgi:hypothetical protein
MAMRTASSIVRVCCWTRKCLGVAEDRHPTGNEEFGGTPAIFAEQTANHRCEADPGA